MYLQQFINHKWVNVISGKLTSKSAFGFIGPVGTTHYWFRVVKPAKAPGYYVGISKSVKI